MDERSRIGFFMVFTLILGWIVHDVCGQNTSGVCFDASTIIYNASSEKTVDGFYSNRTYSFFTAVTQELDTMTNQSLMYQNYWMKATPLPSTSWHDLPFGGCLLVLSQEATSNLQPNDAISNPQGVTTCEVILPKGCNEAWLRQLNESVVQLPKSYLNDTVASCEALNMTTPYECSGVFYNNSAPIAAFGTPFSGISSNEFDAACSNDIDIFNGSSHQNAFARDSQSNLASALHADLNTTIGNNTVYDYFVKRTNAVFMVAWPRTPTNQHSSLPVVNSVCLCPEEHILNNSRDPVNGNAAISTKRTPNFTDMVLIMAFWICQAIW